MERDAEAAADQFSHAAGRPKIGGEPMSGRLLSQPRSHLLVLLGGQKPWPAGCGLGGQAGVPFAAMAGHPLGDRNAVNTQTSSDRDLGLPSRHGPDRPHSNGFQFASRSFASHEAGT